jgi:hypothetical protein
MYETRWLKALTKHGQVMEKTLIRMLSTGRVGTKFVAAAFADQGYQAFHENLYAGEPSSAIIQYTRMLGDLWISDRQKYYALESDFARPYIDTVLEIISEDNRPSRRLRKKIVPRNQNRAFHSVVIHTGNVLTAATPLIEKEAEKRELTVKTLILLRNPLKTIHAIYTVESPSSAWGGPYHNWPSKFFNVHSFLGAADIWAHIYRLAMDQKNYFKDRDFDILRLEKFSKDIRYVRKLFAFSQLDLDEKRFENFCHVELDKPLRNSKVDSVRNSHLFHNPDLVFSPTEIDAIYSEIKDVIHDYEIDWQESVHEYLEFHANEKSRIGFA